MSWVNLDDVYVNKSGDSIAGNLSVGGALTINDAKGSGGTYNVANEITTLRDSVSPTLVDCNITKVPTVVCKIGNIVIVTVSGTMKQSLGAWGTLDLSYDVPKANQRYNAHLFSQDTTDPRILLSVTGTHLFIESKGASVTGWTFGQLVYSCEQYSVSQPPIEAAKTSGSASYESFRVDLPTAKMGCLICVYNNRPLCSTVFPISHFIKYNTNASNCVDCYYVSDISLHATAYYQNGYLYLQSGNKAVKATFVVFQYSVSQMQKDNEFVLYGAPGQASYVHIKRFGHTCILVWAVSQSTNEYWGIEHVIPENLRPNYTIYSPSCVTNASGYILNVCAYGYVHPSGTIGFQVAASTSGAINRGICSWSIK